VPNAYVQQVIGHPLLNGLDGELCVGNPYANEVFNLTQRGVSAQAGAPDFVFHVFDYWNGPEGVWYEERLRMLQLAFSTEPYCRMPRVKLLEQVLVHDIEQLDSLLENWNELGYEGGMGRSVDGPYKFGRSTQKQGYLLKFKKWSTGEARVTGVKELMRNENELEENELGLAKRSTAKDGKVPSGIMGSLAVVDLVSGQPFSIGSGFTPAQRAQIWADHIGAPASYTETHNGYETTLICQPTGRAVVGRFWHYKHFEKGAKDAPRFPISIGERFAADIGDPA
jgi:DNA ligase 1